MKTSLGSQDGAPDACPAPVLRLFLRKNVSCCSCNGARLWAGLVVAAIVLLVASHRPLLRLAAAPCIGIADRPIEGCGKLIFYGDANSYYRSAHYDAAAELWRSRIDLKIVVLDSQSPVPVQLGAMPASGEFIRRQLVARGVAASEVEIVPQQFRDERAAAQWLGAELANEPTLRVMLVVDEYQSKRLGRLIDAVLPAEISARVGLWPLPASAADRGDWFRSRDGVKRLMNGWQGLLASALADDIAPDDLWEADRLMTVLERRIAGATPMAESEQSP